MPPVQEPVKITEAKPVPVAAEPLEEMKQPSGPSETDLLVAKIKAAREAQKNKPKEAA